MEALFDCCQMMGWGVYYSLYRKSSLYVVGWLSPSKGEIMKHTKLFLLVVLFLSACATPAISAPTQTSTPEPTATQTLIPTSTPTATPVPTQVGGGSGKLIFNYARIGGYEKSFPDVKGDWNVFTANWDGTDLTPITSGLNGNNFFQDISPDGRKILVSSSFPNNQPRNDADLYVVYLDGSLEPQKIASGLSGNAIWLNNDAISFIAKEQQTPSGVFSIKSDGTGLKRISKNIKDQDGAIFPVTLLGSTDATRVYWSGCSDNGSYWVCRGKIWWSNTDGSKQSAFYLEAEGNVISPDGSMVVWNKPVHRAVGDCCAIYVSSVSETDRPRSTLENAGNNYQVIWYPDSSKVLLFTPTSEFSGKIYPYAAYILSPTDLTYKKIDFPISKEVLPMMSIHDFSPDGKQILFWMYDKVISHTNEYGGTTLEGVGGATRILNMETMTFSEEFTNHITQDATLGEQTQGVYWLP
jgi:hypothetical protein